MGSLKNRRHHVKRGDQVLRCCPVWIWDRTRPGADRVWGELNSLETYGRCRSAFPSLAHLQRATNMGRDAVISAIRQLEGIGALEVERTTGKSNEYRTRLEPPENRGASRETSRESRPVGESEGFPGDMFGPPHENGGSDQSGIPTRSTEEAPAPASAGGGTSGPDPFSDGFAGIENREVAYCWGQTWKAIFGAPYAWTGPDKAAVAVAARAFNTPDEARAYFREVIPWMRNDRFWAEHLSLKSAMGLRSRFLVGELKPARSSGLQEDDGVVARLRAEYAAAAAERPETLSREEAAAFGITLPNLQSCSSAGTDPFAPTPTESG